MSASKSAGPRPSEGITSTGGPRPTSRARRLTSPCRKSVHSPGGRQIAWAGGASANPQSMAAVRAANSFKDIRPSPPGRFIRACRSA